VKDLVTRCGYRCNLCLAYRENIHSIEDQKKVSDGWFRIYGFRIPPEMIRCDGCLTPDIEKPKLIDTECPVRPCVTEKGFQNCAYCGEYVCEKFKQRMVTYESVARRFGKPIPKEDYENFVRPYENKKIIDELRKRLR